MIEQEELIPDNLLGKLAQTIEGFSKACDRIVNQKALTTQHLRSLIVNWLPNLCRQIGSVCEAAIVVSQQTEEAANAAYVLAQRTLAYEVVSSAIAILGEIKEELKGALETFPETKGKLEGLIEDLESYVIVFDDDDDDEAEPEAAPPVLEVVTSEN